MNARVTLEFKKEEAYNLATQLVNPKHGNKQELIEYFTQKILDDYTESSNLVALHNGIGIDHTTDTLNTLKEADLGLFISSKDFVWSVDKEATAAEFDTFKVDDENYCIPVQVLHVNKFKSSYNLQITYKVMKSGSVSNETVSATLNDLYVVDNGYVATVKDFLTAEWD
jgi:hypothetical protein